MTTGGPSQEERAELIALAQEAEHDSSELAQEVLELERARLKGD